MAEPKEAAAPPSVMTPTTFLHFQSPAIQARPASNLYDRQELKALAIHLAYSLTPRWSPRAGSSGGGDGSSELYDSYELKAVAVQLNSALHATKHGMPIHNSNIRCTSSLKQRQKQRLLNGPADEAESEKGLVPKFWKKVKRAIFRIEKA